MSLYGRDFLRNADELLRTKDGKHYDVQFKEHGYLFLASTSSGREQLIKNNATQIKAGCEDIKLLDRDELRYKFPWMNTDDIMLGSYGQQGEGWFDPHALIMGLKAKAIEMGVKFINGEPVSAKRDESSGKILSVDIRDAKNDVTHNVKYVVNAAGAQAEGVMNLLAGGPDALEYPLPVKPRKRCIFFFHCAAKEGVPPVAPLSVDPTNIYFRSEGSENATFLCGVSPDHNQDPDVYNLDALDNADGQLFEDIIWPALFHRVPAFGDIKVRSSWAGLYEYNVIDQNGIIDFHPEISNCLVSAYKSHILVAGNG
jgi:glycine/D-amino acid oxidase-like deaminating enzyme